MGDPLHDLEKRLEQLVPHGLSDQGRTRLEAQIDELAAGVESADKVGGRWQRFAAVAAVITVVAGIAIFDRFDQGGREPVAAPSPEPVPEMALGPGIEVVDCEREVEDGRDGEIVLSRFNEPMRAWNYNVRVKELVLDKETGLHVRIVSERQEEVLIAVTSF